ncbi:MAG: hypothetical protein KAR40_16880 [Candidatus Sabulitectum sp.]|nr:hypothetical protein [Candidatus Sabulitectum sp.]
MYSKILLISYLLLLVGIAGCIGGSNSEIGNDTEKWKAWAESSSEGLWENDENKAVNPAEVYSFGGESTTDIIYEPLDADIAGDTLFVTDWALHQVVCFKTDGTILWRCGEHGEGPGHFSDIGNIAVGEDVVAVCNRSLGRVDILDRFSGEWKYSIPVAWPYDVDISGDTLAVASVVESDLISLFSISNGEFLSGMGAGFWDDNAIGRLAIHGNANLNIAFDGELVLLSSYFQKSAAVFSASSGELVAMIDRDMPVQKGHPHDNGAGATVVSVYVVDCGIKDDIVYMVLGSYDENVGEKEPSDITIMDRYNLDGAYLDSIVLPQRIDAIDFSEDMLVATDTYYDCVVLVYSFI